MQRLCPGPRFRFRHGPAMAGCPSPPAGRGLRKALLGAVNASDATVGVAYVVPVAALWHRQENSTPPPRAMPHRVVGAPKALVVVRLPVKQVGESPRCCLLRGRSAQGIAASSQPGSAATAIDAVVPDQEMRPRRTWPDSTSQRASKRTFCSSRRSWVTSSNAPS